MALTQSQQDLAKSLAVLLGTTLHLVPDQADVQEYVQLINTEVSTIASTVPGTNPVADETEAALAVLNAIANVIPDGTNGKKKFKAAVSMVTGIVHMVGL